MLSALTLLAGCATKPAQNVSTAPIKIGAVPPFSGGVELYGRQAKVGLDLAAKEINAGGSILGHRVERSFMRIKLFQGNDVTATWHKDAGKGTLTPAAMPSNS